MKDIKIVNEEKPLRYIAVYDELFKMISEGSFDKGTRLPSEPKLAEMLGVSRTTLRQALALLQDDGFIKNIQGKGNYIIKNQKEKVEGLESLSNPIKKSLNEEIDEIEIDFHIEPPNDYMKKALERDTAVVVVADRWYKSKGKILAYTFSLIPVETVSAFKLDLNNKNDILAFLEDKIYSVGKRAVIKIKTSHSGTFSAKKYKLSSSGNCILLNEGIYLDSDCPAVFNKHYLPIEYSNIVINIG